VAVMGAGREPIRHGTMKRTIFLSVPSFVLLFVSCVSLNDTAHCASGTTKQAMSGHEAIEGFAARYGFPPPCIGGKAITLKSKYTTMVLETNSRKLLFNGILIWMNGPVVKKDGEWSIPKVDTTKTIDPLLRADKALASAGYATVVIDPGHGGRDPGAIGRRKVHEKKVVLDIAKRVRKRLRASGVTVKLTRERDSALSLAARAAKAKEWKADIFVSIHCNSAHNSKAAGLETYVVPAAGFSSTAGNNDRNTYSGNRYDAANILLGYHVHKEMLAHVKGADRGIRRARFDVIRDAPCPAILVECGFVSNRDEERKMLESEYRDNVARGIAQGILTYVGKSRKARQSEHSLMGADSYECP